MKALFAAVLVSLLSAAALADEPRPPLTETRAAAEATPGTPLAADVPPSRTAAQSDADAQAARDKAAREQAQAAKQLRQHGYSPKNVKDGRVLWCRSETPLGSRFSEERCSTLEAVLESERHGKDYTKSVVDSSLQDRAGK